MISKLFPIQAFIALTIIASSLTTSVNAVPRYAPIVDLRQESQQELDADAMNTCVPQSNPDFSCFNATLTPTSSGNRTIPFDTCANSVVPGPCVRGGDCNYNVTSTPCFRGLCPNADPDTIDCLNWYFYVVVMAS